jgi:hypothetical protein
MVILTLKMFFDRGDPRTHRLWPALTEAPLEEDPNPQREPKLFANITFQKKAAKRGRIAPIRIPSTTPRKPAPGQEIKGRARDRSGIKAPGELTLPVEPLKPFANSTPKGYASLEISAI